MAIAFRSASAIAGVASGNVTLALPAGVTDADLMVAPFIGDDAVAISKSGWVNFASVDNGGAALRGQALSRIAATESGSQVFTHAAGGSTDGLIVAFSGVATVSTINQSSAKGSASAGTAATTNSITPTVDGCMIVQVYLVDGDSSSVSAYANTGTALTWTERVDTGDGTTAFKRIAVATATQTTAAAIAASATISASSNWNSIIFAIAPAAATAAAGGARLSTRSARGPQRFRRPTLATSDFANPNLSVAISTAGQVTLAGQSFSSSIAVPISNGAVTLAGQSFTANLGTPIAAGAVVLAGQSVVASIAVPVSAGAVTLGGQTVTSTIGLPVDIVAGAITLAGQSFTSSIAVPITAGAVSLAGQSLTIALAVPVAAGAVTLAGQDATIGIAGGSGNLSVSIDAAGQITLSGQTFAVDLAGQPSGVVDVTGGGASYGAQFWFHYEREQQRRRKRRRELQAAEEAADAIAEPVTQEIAQILQAQERKDDQRAELERLRELVARFPLETGSPRLQAAVERVRERQTFSSLVALDKELRRMMDEEDAALVMLLLGD